ncbi:MAG: ankyrin repeat domain-containing protein [Synergistaceae bacterium]|nr:ankyrin repeat domain-containing protein [Synergistaceae bacterium]
MFNSKKLMLVVAVMVLAVSVSALPSWGASFKNRTISDQQFLDLCRNGDVNGVRRALRAGISSNTKDKDGRSALMYAAAGGHTEVVDILLSASADITHYGGAALVHAATHGHTATVNVLLKAGASVESKNNSGNTALMMAARNGYASTVDRLLKAGADINAKNQNGWTALMYAAENGHSESIEALLLGNPDVNIQNTRNNSGEADFGGRTALMLAAKNGHTDIVDTLIEAGADDKSDVKGRTALMLAAESANSATVNALIDAGSYVKQADADNRTALDYARKNPNIAGTPTFQRLEALSK